MNISGCSSGRLIKKCFENIYRFSWCGKERLIRRGPVYIPINYIRYGVLARSSTVFPILTNFSENTKIEPIDADSKIIHIQNFSVNPIFRKPFLQMKEFSDYDQSLCTIRIIFFTYFIYTFSSKSNWPKLFRAPHYYFTYSFVFQAFYTALDNITIFFGKNLGS